MRCNVWHLHPVDVIVSADHMIETMLPVHCHKWHSIIIVKQESAISVYSFLHFRCISVLDNCLKHLCHILCDWQYKMIFFFSGCFCDILIRGRIRPERKYYVTKIICFFQERNRFVNCSDPGASFYVLGQTG